MNERIKELAYQAGFYINPDFEHPLTKFAELIVRECVDRIENTTFLGDTKEWFEPNDVLWTAAQQIKEHFGVEE
jgi:hypothetical protein